ncbi:MAG TPA: sulfite exporter TauE/SafE family protein [Anaeromyxobacteraceae bacterium]|nr:sulfite exporter TauE/SafE family protein [Anaeromyxobacteraceae bacterium]
MSADLALALTTGLLGGFGHCLGMCGPLVGGLALATGPRLSARAALSAQAVYHLGRVTTYGAVGAAMGLFGSFVDVAGRLAGAQRVASAAAGLFMIAMGLGAAGIAGWARRLEARAADRVVAAVRGLLEGGGPGRLYPMGLLLGLLPCGLSYSIFVGSAATGAPVPGMLLALAFGLGTAPALLLAGAAAAALSQRLRGWLYRAGGLLVVAMGVLFVLRGLGRWP